ncbi:MAG: OsmC family protein [Hyphomicrobiaceae bacterium]
MADSQERHYSADARSTDTIGRVLCSARNHHFVIDGPPQAGFPGEALGPGEVFLAGIASCGVELVQALARDDKLPLERVKVDINGMMDRANPVRSDVSLFNRIELQFELAGVTQADGESLIGRFREK